MSLSLEGDPSVPVCSAHLPLYEQNETSAPLRCKKVCVERFGVPTVSANVQDTWSGSWQPTPPSIAVHNREQNGAILLRRVEC